MKKSLFDVMSKAVMDTQVDGKNTLYFSGKFAGYNYKIKKVKDLENLKKTLNAVMKELNLGRVEKIENNANKIMIRINGKPVSENHFITGLITGLISKALDYNFYKFTGREIKKKRDDKFYVFEVKSI
jgi:hypothetical protein